MTQSDVAVRDARFKDLVDLLHSIKPEIYDPFDVAKAHYTSAGVLIPADILVPKGVDLSTPRPVIVRIHGGFLVTGSSLFPGWFSKWVLDFAAENGAVIISPDYRLLPEIKGRDILSDLRAFWSWVQSGGPQRHLAAVGQSKVSLDITRLLLLGESAGGYLALQSVLLGLVRPRALTTLYPMLDMKSDYYNKSYEKPIVHVPNFPNSTVDSFVKNMSGTSITGADPPTRLDLALAIVQNGRVLEFLGDDPELFVLDRLRAGELRPRDGKTLLPPLYILHGRQDSAVPVSGTIEFLKLLKEVDGRARVHAVIQDGDHGFDAMTTTQEPWMREGLEFIKGEWLGGVEALRPVL